MKNEILDEIIHGVNEKIQQGTPAGISQHDYAASIMLGVYTAIECIEKGAFSKAELYLMSNKHKIIGLK